MLIEIENWHEYTDEEKTQIIQRIDDLGREDPKEYPKYK